MANTTISKELREAFMKIVESGDEAKAREFLVAHLKEFPEDTQDVIITAFFEEALVKKNKEDGLISNFRKQGINDMNALGATKEELEKHAKLAEIKESL